MVGIYAYRHCLSAFLHGYPSNIAKGRLPHECERKEGHEKIDSIRSYLGVEVWDPYYADSIPADRDLIPGESILQWRHHLFSRILVGYIDGKYIQMQRDYRKPSCCSFFEATADGSAQKRCPYLCQSGTTEKLALQPGSRISDDAYPMTRSTKTTFALPIVRKILSNFRRGSRFL